MGGRVAWGHGGSLDGFETSMWYLPSLDTAVVIIWNRRELDTDPIASKLAQPGGGRARPGRDAAHRWAPRGSRLHTGATVARGYVPGRGLVVRRAMTRRVGGRIPGPATLGRWCRGRPSRCRHREPCAWPCRSAPTGPRWSAIRAIDDRGNASAWVESRPVIPRWVDESARCGAGGSGLASTRRVGRPGWPCAVERHGRQPAHVPGARARDRHRRTTQPGAHPVMGARRRPTGPGGPRSRAASPRPPRPADADVAVTGRIGQRHAPTRRDRWRPLRRPRHPPGRARRLACWPPEAATGSRPRDGPRHRAARAGTRPRLEPPCTVAAWDGSRPVGRLRRAEAADQAPAATSDSLMMPMAQVDLVRGGDQRRDDAHHLAERAGR